MFKEWKLYERSKKVLQRCRDTEVKSVGIFFDRHRQDAPSISDAKYTLDKLNYKRVGFMDWINLLRPELHRTTLSVILVKTRYELRYMYLYQRV